MSLFERLAKEWPVISATPYSSSLLLLAVLLAAVFGAHLWNRREMNAIRAEKANADAATRLVEKQRDGYKVEAENYKKDLEKAQKISGPEQLAPVMYGNTAVQDAFVRVTQAPTNSVTLLTLHPDSLEADFEKFAAYMRLREAGLAEFKPSGNATVVTSTSAANELSTQFPGPGKKSTGS